MHYVILRDDDTNALTPVECLERLYRPFLERGLKVNLATIPSVNTEAVHTGGAPELFLLAKASRTPKYLPIACNEGLLNYLKSNPEFHIVQHGCHHELVEGKPEFDLTDRHDIARRLDAGIECLQQAGLPRPETFVAPYDRFTGVSLQEVAARFRVISTGWFEFGRLPRGWLPGYALKKLLRRSHWEAGTTSLLTHPGCLLSYHRCYAAMLDEIQRAIESRRVTVLVTHWWEYFRDGKPDEAFIAVLHDTAAYLAGRKDVRVISFEELARGDIALN